MANPFLVLGGIAVGIITAGFGILQVPGWVAAAQDAAAVNDLSSAAITEAALASQTGAYNPGSTLTDDARAGATFSVSDGVTLCVTASPDGKAFAAVARSASGEFFLRTNEVSTAIQGPSPAAVVGILGGLPAGVTQPFGPDGCATGAKVPGSEDVEPGAGGETPGGEEEEQPEVIAAACDVGTTVSLGQARGAAYTSHGVFAVSGNQLLCSTGDSLSHPVIFDGGDSLTAYSVTSDAANNVYVTGTYNGESGVFKIAPDLTATSVLTAASPSNLVIKRATDGVFVYNEGTSLRHVSSAGTVADIALPSVASSYPLFLGVSAGNTFWSDNVADSYIQVVDSSGAIVNETMSKFSFGANRDVSTFAVNNNGLLAPAPNGQVSGKAFEGAGFYGGFSLANLGLAEGTNLAVYHLGEYADGGQYLRVGVNPSGNTAESWLIVRITNAYDSGTVVMR